MTREEKILSHILGDVNNMKELTLAHFLDKIDEEGSLWVCGDNVVGFDLRKQKVLKKRATKEMQALIGDSGIALEPMEHYLSFDIRSAIEINAIQPDIDKKGKKIEGEHKRIARVRKALEVLEKVEYRIKETLRKADFKIRKTTRTI